MVSDVTINKSCDTTFTFCKTWVESMDSLHLKNVRLGVPQEAPCARAVLPQTIL